MKKNMARAAAVAGSLAIAGAFAVSCSQAQDATKDAMSSAASLGSSAASAAGSVASSAGSAAGSAASSAASVAGSAASSGVSVASSAVSSVLNGTPTTMNVPGVGDVSMDAAMAGAYTQFGGEEVLGMPTAMAEKVGDGTVQAFTGGTIFSSPTTGVHLVQGEILRIYTEQGGAAGMLGFPTSDEAQTGGGYKVPGGGWITEFQNGTITWTNTGNGTFGETVTKN